VARLSSDTVTADIPVAFFCCMDCTRGAPLTLLSDGNKSCAADALFYVLCPQRVLQVQPLSQAKTPTSTACVDVLGKNCFSSKCECSTSKLNDTPQHPSY
jgi:hypothetical protein